MVGEFLGLLHETLGHLPSLSGSPADHRKEHRAAVEMHAHAPDQAGGQRGAQQLRPAKHVRGEFGYAVVPDAQ